MKAPLPWPWLSLNGGTGAGGLGEEAPGEGLPPAGCGRSHFPGYPATGCAYHCLGCSGRGAPGAGRTGNREHRLRGTGPGPGPGPAAIGVPGTAGAGHRNRSQPQAPRRSPHRRVDAGAGAGLGGEERRGVSEERDTVLQRRGAGPPAGRPLLPVLSRRLPRPGALCGQGPPRPLGHAAEPAVPGWGRLWTRDSRAAARGRRDRERGVGPGQEAVVHQRGVRRPGAAPEGREGVRQHQSSRYGGLQEREDLLWGGDGRVMVG